MGKLFGTDGVRGEANTELTPELAFRLGRVGAYMLTKQVKAAPRVLVAKDSRRSGDMLEAALAAGLCSIGAVVYQAGVIPTPAVAYLVQKYNLDAGVMITASHNTMNDNGIKFFNNKGFKLPDAVEDEIEKLVSQLQMGNDNLPRPIGEGVGVMQPCDTGLDDYISYLLSTVPGLDLTGIKVALDCANGATSEAASIVFEKLNATVHTLHNTPDGTNINANCGSTHMESLQEYMKAQGADIGLAFDGDGDRVLALCEKGELLDGDKILALCGSDMKERGKLEKNTIVATVMSNQGLELYCNKKGLILHRTDVGDRYVLEKMLADNLTLGGEQSGHVIFLSYGTTGNGILTGLQMLSIMARKKKSISALTSEMEILPQVLVNVKVPNHRKAELATCENIQKAQSEIESAMNGEGRILVRPSGTEPVVRVMLEGRDLDKITNWANNLKKVIEKNLES